MDNITNIATFHGSVIANALGGLISGLVIFGLGFLTGKTVERRSTAKINNKNGKMSKVRINSDDNGR